MFIIHFNTILLVNYYLFMNEECGNVRARIPRNESRRWAKTYRQLRNKI